MSTTIVFDGVFFEVEELVHGLTDGAPPRKPRQDLGRYAQVTRAYQPPKVAGIEGDPALRDYDTYRAAHRARKRGEPERTAFHVDAHGPYFKDRAMNRDGHSPFGKDD